MAVQTGFAEVNGAKLYYEVAGEGHPIVFTHAGIADSRMWDDQFPVFAKNYLVIRWDMRGFGKSEPVEGDFTFYDDLYGLLKFLKVDRTYLVGCSMGGGASMNLTVLHPEMVDALVMVGSAPGGLWLDIIESPLYQDLEEANKKADLEQVLELEARIFFDGEGRTPQDVNQAARAKLMEMNRQAHRHAQRNLGQHKPPMKPSANERLNELKLPILVVYGDRDEDYIVKAAQYMSDHVAGLRKVLMPNTAHLPNMERPDEFNQIVLDFLSSVK